MIDPHVDELVEGIAIIGMSGRFPGAKNVDAFWNNLRDGVESVTFFSEEEALDAGTDPAQLRMPNFVRAAALLEDIDRFDAAFFGYTPREAAAMDPQQRLFLECAWQALESAGYDPETCPGRVGVYAGAGLTSYLLFNLVAQNELTKSISGLQTVLGNDKDYIATRVAYKLNLKGPGLTVQTACSTSLVAVHLACQALLTYQADMALAGGASIIIPQKGGYLYQPEGILSPDGHCRAFDARAQGTIGGSGVGVVALKRLSEALADGDTVYAVIRSSAINNDGSVKVGYTAPSVEGQSKVIAEALALADVDPETIGYVEAHGTGTPLGDPIEFKALTQAFRAATARTGFCAIGSVKTNIGHLDAAAGVAGLIKTVLALRHKELPPSLHFERPNPQIDLANSPFYVNTARSPWPSRGGPRRAGVSSFGLGGTNAHVILEEAPPAPPADASRPWQLLVLSARTLPALDRSTASLAAHLRDNPALSIADIAYTLMVGRPSFNYRRMVLCRDHGDALAALETDDPQRVGTAYQEPPKRPVVFMFPGNGAQYVDMGRALYQHEPVFRQQVDRCAELLRRWLGCDLRDAIYPPPQRAAEVAERIRQPRLAMPAIFAIAYAMAGLWMSWGVQPQAMIGHSLGEYVAACLAGVFTLEEALMLVAERGRLMELIPGGGALSVPLPEAAARRLLGKQLALAAINGPSQCVISGPIEAIEELAQRLTDDRQEFRRLQIAFPAHSEAIVPILEPFAQIIAQLDLHAPSLPFVSSVTGDWISAQEAVDPAYWVRHLRQTVRFGQGIAVLLEQLDPILLDVGPGTALGSLARGQVRPGSETPIVSSIRHPADQQDDMAVVLRALGQLWLARVPIDTAAFYADERRRRVPLPTYPFEGQRFWIAPPRASTGAAPLKRTTSGDSFYIPSWKRSMLPRRSRHASPAQPAERCWLVFTTPRLGAQIARRLEQAGHDVITVAAGRGFASQSERAYTIDPRRPADYDALIESLRAANTIPQEIVHCWGAASDEPAGDTDAHRAAVPGLGFGSLLLLTQAIGRQLKGTALGLSLVASGIYDVDGSETLHPHQAAIAGLCQVIPQEYPHISCRTIDSGLSRPDDQPSDRLLGQILEELGAPAAGATVAYRGAHRWVRTYERVQIDKAAAPPLREGGAYLITGGLAGMGLTLARRFARMLKARLVLVEPHRLDDPDRPRIAGPIEDDDRLRQVRELEQLGAHVLALSADVADREQMLAVIGQARERFGPLHGVIHAAGNDERACPIQELDRTSYEAQFAHKVYALTALDSILPADQPDFRIALSTLAAVRAQKGQGAYAAAALFLDALAQQRARAGSYTWVSLSWEVLPGAEGAPAWALSEGESWQALAQLLSVDPLPQICVSPIDLSNGLWLDQAQAEPEMDDEPRYSRPELPTGYVAPRNQLEQQIAGIWQQIFGIDQAGIHDNFFNLGGHSLLAMQLVARLRSVLNVEVSISQLFGSPTIAGLAAFLAERQPAGPSQPAPRAAIAHDQPQTLPLTYTQEQAWVRNKVLPARYNAPTALRFRGAFDVGLLRRSLAEIVRRQPALRATFKDVDGRPVQIISPTLDLHLPIIDLQALPHERREAIAGQLLVDALGTPFHAALEGPLIRVHLLRLGQHDHMLFINMSLIICDGSGLRVVVDSLLSFYDALVQGRQLPAPDMPLQYADLVATQVRWMQSAEAPKQLAYWKRQLEGMPDIDLAGDRPRPPIKSFKGGRIPVRLSERSLRPLRLLSQQEEVTLYMSMLATLALLMAHHSGLDDIMTNTTIAMRDVPGSEKLVGNFTNTLFLRTRLAGDPTFRELLARVRTMALEAYAHKDMPFECVLEHFYPDDGDQLPSPMRIAFTLHSTPLAHLTAPGLNMEVQLIDIGKADFDLSFTLVQRDDTASGFVEYDSDMFDRATVVSIFEQYESLIAHGTNNPDQRISTLLRTLDQPDALELHAGQVAAPQLSVP